MDGRVFEVCTKMGCVWIGLIMLLVPGLKGRFVLPTVFNLTALSAFVSVVPSISTISVAYEWCDLV